MDFSLHTRASFSDSSRLLFHAGIKAWIAFTYFAAFSWSIVFSCDGDPLVCTRTYVHTRRTHERSRRDSRRLRPTSPFVPLRVEIPVPSCVRFLFLSLSFSLHSCPFLSLSLWATLFPSLLACRRIQR